MNESELDPFVRGLQVAMELTGWKAAPLSKAAGMGETAVRDLIRKQSSPKVSTAKALAAVMGMTVDQILELAHATAAIQADETLTARQRIMSLWDSLPPERRHLLEGYAEYLASQEQAAAEKPGE